MSVQIWNSTIGRLVDVPDEAVEQYLTYPEYSREAPAPDPPAKGKKQADPPPADPPPADPPVGTP